MKLNVPEWFRVGLSRHWKLGSAILAAILLPFWGTEILQLLGEGVILALETLELLADTLLEHLFGFSGHFAEAIAVWIGMIVLLVYLYSLYRKVRRWLKRLWASLGARLQAGDYWHRRNR